MYILLAFRPVDEQEIYELIIDMVARWNSFCHSAQRAVYLNAAINELCSLEQVRYRRQ